MLKIAPATEKAWIDSILVLETAAELNLKDEMYIYGITATNQELAGGGMFAFLVPQRDPKTGDVLISDLDPGVRTPGDIASAYRAKAIALDTAGWFKLVPTYLCNLLIGYFLVKL